MNDEKEVKEVSNPDSSSRFLMWLFVALVPAVVIVYAVMNRPRSQDQLFVANSNEQNVITEEKYRDGRYEVIGEYIAPSGPEQINVSVVLNDGVITESEVGALSGHPVSLKLQEAFIGGHNKEVVGKNIDEINLSVVSGSSLTPRGFNDALEKIKAEAAL